MKIETLSLLIVDEDQSMRQLLAAFVTDRYGAVTAAAPDEIGRSIVLESFDLMIARRTRVTSAEDEVDSSEAERLMGTAIIRSAVSGNIYEFTAITQRASSPVSSPFERVMLQVAIERSELSQKQVKRITEHDALF